MKAVDFGQPAEIEVVTQHTEKICAPSGTVAGFTFGSPAWAGLPKRLRASSADPEDEASILKPVRS